MSCFSMSWVRTGIIVAALWALLAMGPANACSLSPDYVHPTNFDLVAHADAIVVARAEADDRRRRGVRFRTVEVLKGSPPSTFFAGYELGRPPFSDPNGLSEPNPEASYGACQRLTYRRGGLYVMFLRLDDGEWREVNYAYARANEDYYGEDSVWIRAIRAYVDIQSRYKGDEQIAALRRLRKGYLDQARAGYDESWCVLASDIAGRIGPRPPATPPSVESAPVLDVCGGRDQVYYVPNPHLPPSELSTHPKREVIPFSALIGALVVLASLSVAAWLAFSARKVPADGREV